MHDSSLQIEFYRVSIIGIITKNFPLFNGNFYVFVVIIRLFLQMVRFKRISVLSPGKGVQAAKKSSHAEFPIFQRLIDVSYAFDTNRSKGKRKSAKPAFTQA